MISVLNYIDWLIVCVHVCMLCVSAHTCTWVHTCDSMHELVRGQLTGASSLLPPCGFWDWIQIIRFGDKHLRKEAVSIVIALQPRLRVGDQVSMVMEEWETGCVSEGRWLENLSDICLVSVRPLRGISCYFYQGWQSPKDNTGRGNLIL